MKLPLQKRIEAIVTGKPYSGPITPKLAALGMEQARINSVALLNEAKLLFNNNHWARSSALAILAIEESAKAAILRGILTAQPKDLKKEWNSFRKHTQKNLGWILPDVFQRGARKMQDFRILFSAQSNHGKVLEKFKQQAIYTDLADDLIWTNPLADIDSDLTEKILFIAEIAVQKTPGAMTSEPELEIWLKHFKGSAKGLTEMKETLLNCYKEAKQKGVLTGDVSLSEVEDFLF